MSGIPGISPIKEGRQGNLRGGGIGADELDFGSIGEDAPAQLTNHTPQKHLDQDGPSSSMVPGEVGMVSGDLAAAASPAAHGSVTSSTTGSQKHKRRRRRRAKISLPPANAPGVLAALPQLPDHLLELVRKGKISPEEYEQETARRFQERNLHSHQKSSRRRKRRKGKSGTSDGGSIRSASVMSVGLGSVAASESGAAAAGGIQRVSSYRMPQQGSIHTPSTYGRPAGMDHPGGTGAGRGDAPHVWGYGLGHTQGQGHGYAARPVQHPHHGQGHPAGSHAHLLPAGPKRSGLRHGAASSGVGAPRIGARMAGARFGSMPVGGLAGVPARAGTWHGAGARQQMRGVSSLAIPGAGSGGAGARQEQDEEWTIAGFFGLRSSSTAKAPSPSANPPAALPPSSQSGPPATRQVGQHGAGGSSSSATQRYAGPFAHGAPAQNGQAGAPHSGVAARRGEALGRSRQGSLSSAGSLSRGSYGAVGAHSGQGRGGGSPSVAELQAAGRSASQSLLSADGVQQTGPNSSGMHAAGKDRSPHGAGRLYQIMCDATSRSLWLLQNLPQQKPPDPQAEQEAMNSLRGRIRTQDVEASVVSHRITSLAQAELDELPPWDDAPEIRARREDLARILGEGVPNVVTQFEVLVRFAGRGLKQVRRMLEHYGVLVVDSTEDGPSRRFLRRCTRLLRCSPAVRRVLERDAAAPPLDQQLRAASGGAAETKVRAAEEHAEDAAVVELVAGLIRATRVEDACRFIVRRRTQRFAELVAVLRRDAGSELARSRRSPLHWDPALSMAGSTELDPRPPRKQLQAWRSEARRGLEGVMSLRRARDRDLLDVISEDVEEEALGDGASLPDGGGRGASGARGSSIAIEPAGNSVVNAAGVDASSGSGAAWQQERADSGVLLPDANESSALARFLDTRASRRAEASSSTSSTSSVLRHGGSRSPSYGRSRGGSGASAGSSPASELGSSVVLRKRSRSNSGSSHLDLHDYVTFVSGAVLRVMEAQAGAVLREELEAQLQFLERRAAVWRGRQRHKAAGLVAEEGELPAGRQGGDVAEAAAGKEQPEEAGSQLSELSADPERTTGTSILGATGPARTAVHEGDAAPEQLRLASPDGMPEAGVARGDALDLTRFSTPTKEHGGRVSRAGSRGAESPELQLDSSRIGQQSVKEPAEQSVKEPAEQP